MYESFASDDEGAQQLVEDPCFPYEDEEELVKELTDSTGIKVTTHNVQVAAHYVQHTQCT
jgi:hypothetical protein